MQNENKEKNMRYESLKTELLKQARDAFERASTLQVEQRIEVYLDYGVAKTSDVLAHDEEIVYSPTRILCYQIYGYDYLEEEIKTWIDYARVQQSDETPLHEPTDVEKSIRELINTLANKAGVSHDAISSYEVFANLPATLLGTIEQEIIEYWWSANEEENGKKLALAQIEEALQSYGEA